MTKLIVAIFLSIIFCSCQGINGSGNIKTKTINVDHFVGITSSGSFDIEVTNDENESVKIEADDNILPYIIAKVENGMLDVRYKSDMSFNNTHVKVYVSAPALNKLFMDGSGDIIAKDTLKADKIEINLSGSGNINAMVDAPSVTAEVSGSGDISLLGKTKEFKGNVEGSGELKAKGLLSENTTVNVGGSGSAHVFASVHLSANVGGSGDIYYSGNPPAHDINKSGSGSVEVEK